MHHASLATSFVRSSILCLVVGTALGATLAPAIAATGTEPPKTKPVGQDSSTRRAAELTKKRAAEQKCVQAEKAMGKAVDSARSAMRQAIGSFHDATDVEAADMTDDDITNLADDAAEELAAAAAACAAAIQAQHDRAVAELTAAHADSKLIARVDKKLGGCRSQVEQMVRYAEHILNELEDVAHGSNDDPPAGGTTQPPAPSGTPVV